MLLIALYIEILYTFCQTKWNECLPVSLLWNNDGNGHNDNVWIEVKTREMRKGNTHMAECPFWLPMQINQWNTYFSLAFAWAVRAPLPPIPGMPFASQRQSHLKIAQCTICNNIILYLLFKKHFRPSYALLFHLSTREFGDWGWGNTHITPHSPFRTMLTKRRFERDFQTI